MCSFSLIAAVAILIMLSGVAYPAPAWAGYMLHKASPNLYWGTIPGEKEMLYLKSLGVKTLINVRNNPLKGHERLAHKLGLNYYHIKTGVVLTPQEKELIRFLSIIRQPENRPAYVFCTLGTDRTCFYVALYRVAVDGWTAKQASDELDAHGLKHWWPTFREYDDDLIAHQGLIHHEVSSWQGPPAARTPADMVDPCMDLIGHRNREVKPTMVAKARRAALTGLFKPLEGLYKGSVLMKAKMNHEQPVTNAVVDLTNNH